MLSGPFSKRILNGMLRAIALFWKLFTDKRTPLTAKLLVGAGALYGVSPLDLIPDILPLVGIGDDLTVIIATLIVFYWKTKHLHGKVQIKPK